MKYSTNIFRSVCTTIQGNFGDNSPGQAKVRRPNQKNQGNKFLNKRNIEENYGRRNGISANFPTAR